MTGTPHAWTSDDQLLVIETHPKGRSLVLIDPTDLEARRDLGPVTDHNNAHADLSPNEQWVALDLRRGDRVEIILRSVAHPEREWQVSNGGGWDPQWSPDGEILYFAGDAGIHSVRVSTRGESVDIGVPDLVFASPWLAIDPDYAVAPDGRLLVIRPADWVLEPAEIRVVVDALAAE